MIAHGSRDAADRYLLNVSRLDGEAEPWDVNIHYEATLTDYVPATAGAVLDVGSGDGFLATHLARHVRHVVAIDIDEPVLVRARPVFRRVSVLEARRHLDRLVYRAHPFTWTKTRTPRGNNNRRKINGGLLDSKAHGMSVKIVM
jgi:SAM-dependent methyltransferase